MDIREAIYLTAAVVGTLAGLVCIWEFLSRRAPALGVPAVPSWQTIRRAMLAVSVVLLFGSCCVCSNWLWQAADRVPLGNILPAAGSGKPIEVTNSIGIRLVRIPAGKFVMGAPPDEPGNQGDEHLHPGEITRPFYLGVFEVTQEEYQRVTGKNPSCHSETGGCKQAVRGLDVRRFPVDSISWLMADEFCRLISDLPAERDASRVYRLPTEAEWEYACRAETTTATYLGPSFSSRDGNIHGEQPYGGAPRGPYLGRTCVVGQYRPNAWGLYDMQGNLAEWCQDWYEPEYYRHSPAKDPAGPPTGFQNRRTVRGSICENGDKAVRSGIRSHAPPGHATAHLGIRLAMDIRR